MKKNYHPLYIYGSHNNRYGSKLNNKTITIKEDQNVTENFRTTHTAESS